MAKPLNEWYGEIPLASPSKETTREERAKRAARHNYLTVAQVEAVCQVYRAKMVELPYMLAEDLTAADLRELVKRGWLEELSHDEGLTYFWVGVAGKSFAYHIETGGYYRPNNDDNTPPTPPSANKLPRKIMTADAVNPCMAIVPYVKPRKPAKSMPVIRLWATVEITRSIPLVTFQGENGAGNNHLLVAETLKAQGIWDGLTPLLIQDPYHIYRKLSYAPEMAHELRRDGSKVFASRQWFIKADTAIWAKRPIPNPVISRKVIAHNVKLGVA